MSSLTNIFVLFFSLIFLIIFASSPGRGAEAPLNYSLSISFDLKEQQLFGTAKIDIAPGQQLSLFFPGLQITGSLLRDQSGHEQELDNLHDGLFLPVRDSEQTLFLSYTCKDDSPTRKQINERGISLTENWHPVPGVPALFSLSARVPETFSAISESDQFPLPRQGNLITTSFSQPITALHFIAGPYVTQSVSVHENLTLHTLFFPEDAPLMDEYLQRAAEHLRTLEPLLGPFPYSHYVIVGNRQPTGLGMPTFTLIGQQVLRLPFIKDTSLVHEIVHSWFGNSVEVDNAEGNWCEGLATFLADHRQREKTGQGREARREAIVKYLNYAGVQADLPLGTFRSASHNQALAEIKRVVGYNRGAMLFHELHEKIGAELFYQSLRNFYREHRHKSASWSDLNASFSETYGHDLSYFFQERLTRTDIPELKIEDSRVEYHGSRPTLKFTLRQQTEKPYSLNIPVVVETMEGPFTSHIETSESVAPITIELESRPLSFRLDPELTMLRRLTDEEYPPVLSQLLGSGETLIILEAEESRERYLPIMEMFDNPKPQIILANTVENRELARNNLLLLGLDGQASRSLFGHHPDAPPGLNVEAYKNPLNPDKIAVTITSTGKAESLAAARLLNHYSKYTSLTFQGGRNTRKTIRPSESGIIVLFEELPEAVATTKTSSFADIAGKLSEKQVVYIGEQHTSVSDHLLQLRLIEALYQRHNNLAIAMEMFPGTAQPVLDLYTLAESDIDERRFLKESRYYDVWRYDFRLFRDIFNFARKHKLPVLGINLDKDIVSSVYRNGTTDELTEAQRQELASDRNLVLPGYAERLSRMHTVHQQGGHGNGLQSGFVQAQAIWDETMAASLATYLESHPETLIVVLAGQQHTRNDSGIPPRLAARLPGIRQASVVNAADGTAGQRFAELADYIFFGEPGELPPLPKMGIILREQKNESEPAGVYIDGISPHGRAGEAGLLTGDRLISIDGMAINSMGDIHIAMLDTRVDEKIPVVVERGGKEESRRMTLDVTLSIMPPVAPHP